MRTMILAGLVLALMLAGCFSSSTTTSTTGAVTTTSTTSSGMMMNHTAKTLTVNIQGSAFVPANLTINVGDTVHWVNMDATTPHSIVSDNGTFTSGACPGTGCLVSGTSAAGKDHYDYTFTTAGTFAYHCGVHANMKATVTVASGMMM